LDAVRTSPCWTARFDRLQPEQAIPRRRRETVAVLVVLA
jgi:hypothetical protein